MSVDLVFVCLCFRLSHTHQSEFDQLCYAVPCAVLLLVMLLSCVVTTRRAYPMFDPQGKPAWSLEESREKGLYAAAVAIAWGSQVGWCM